MKRVGKRGVEGEQGALTGPCERWRATGKGRTVGLGKDMKGVVRSLCESEMPFSTMEPTN